LTDPAGLFQNDHRLRRAVSAARAAARSRVVPDEPDRRDDPVDDLATMRTRTGAVGPIGDHAGGGPGPIPIADRILFREWRRDCSGSVVGSMDCRRDPAPVAGVVGRRDEFGAFIPPMCRFDVTRYARPEEAGAIGRT
jgi:hypothetical protein